VNFDFVFLAPLVAEFVEGFIGAGHPVIPAAECQLTCSVSASDIRSGDNSRCS
jgi:hypothetical protein